MNLHAPSPQHSLTQACGPRPLNHRPAALPAPFVHHATVYCSASLLHVCVTSTLLVFLQMAFFGITTLGPREPVADQIAINQEREFHQISDEQYWAAFDRYLLGDSPTARTLEIDGSENILRASLGDMLR